MNYITLKLQYTEISVYGPPHPQSPYYVKKQSQISCNIFETLDVSTNMAS